ncbi:carbamoyltransferase HypF [Geminocystis sp. CENA526]|uniref:carbamoyltransferase HypF n=1 Tax=Geminocystis sp. CENA526 TaxID=1355871 RepID=UPI003D6FED99
MTKICYKISIRGIVQGVGFRPFIYKLAQELGLKGWVNNSVEGVSIEVESDREKLQIFINKIKEEKPPHSRIDSIEIKEFKGEGYQEFIIKNSETINHQKKTTLVLPDLSVCSDCLTEIFDPNNRRYRYPFTNCTNCGPRYSIIQSLPYDRVFTTMNKFIMCEECKKEYYNPKNRRFHAQPNACQKCGANLELWDKQGNCLSKFDDALTQTANLIKQGKIIALKGLGGFHLIADARNKQAIDTLRKRKNRPHKPLALMYPNLEQIKNDCLVSDLEEKLLLSSASPIVLVKKKDSFTQNKAKNQQYLICEEIAPNNPYLGVMLPYTPLHHLLLNLLNFPVVATSGNQKSEPICIDEYEALERLNLLADYFLIHNRPIFRAVDDSIVRIVNNEIIILRRGRGYAPLPIKLEKKSTENSAQILALGGHLKNTISIEFNQQIFVSQHIGDLDNLETIKAYKNTIKNLSDIYDFTPDLIVCDAHPNYFSTQYAEELSKIKNPPIPIISVQHHLAHIFATIAEHNLKLPLLGIAWDGTGYGLDNTIWGGEFFYINEKKIQRIASFLPFPLIGGNQAILQPQRIALGLLNTVYNGLENIPQNLPILTHFSSQELALFQKMIDKKINTPLTSSVGRLFDGIAFILDIIKEVTFEGQAPMALEFLIDNSSPDKLYNFHWTYDPNNCNYIDVRSMVTEIIRDYLDNKSLGLIATKFHLTLVEIIKHISQKVDTSTVILSGGCFQNKYLLEHSINTLIDHNFKPYWSQKIPLNDGGLSVGQIQFAKTMIGGTSAF